MGIALWVASGVFSFVLARVVPIARKRPWLPEMVIAIVTALLLGVVATKLDFGGWREPDWRAGLFAVFGSFAVIGTYRAVQSRKHNGGPS